MYAKEMAAALILELGYLFSALSQRDEEEVARTTNAVHSMAKALERKGVMPEPMHEILTQADQLVRLLYPGKFIYSSGVTNGPDQSLPHEHRTALEDS